ncbi:MAG: energy transducer TonB [Gemmatimonadetes bacterium]|nr:energy transducer TonB [Gemmatimonadota bacterium]
MFDHLIESRPERSYGGVLGYGVVSIVVHAVLITGAVYATVQAVAIEDRIQQLNLTVAAPDQPEDEPPPDEPTVVPPPKGFQTLAVPASIPVDIPPPSEGTFNAADFSGVGVEGGVFRGREDRPVISDQPYLEAVVEERPERVGGIPPRYPEILRQAGIEGRVLVEVVIDTLGRAERGSLRILSSTHQLFEAPAREAVANSVYRPGRIQGRAVRVRVQIPLNFTITR